MRLRAYQGSVALPGKVCWGRWFPYDGVRESQFLQKGFRMHSAPEFALAFPPRESLVSVRELARAAEDAGIDAVGISDSQSLYRDVHIACAAAAEATKRVLVGSSVTNPVTRHVAVTAGAAMSLSDWTGGRSFVGIGSGDSSVLNLGLRPARLSEFESFIVALRSLFRTGTTTLSGDQFSMRWLALDGGESGSRPAVPPVFVAAEGPKTLEMAGRAADGVMAGMGLTDEVVAAAKARISLGRQQALCAPDTFSQWWVVKGYLGTDIESSITKMLPTLAASAHHAFRHTLEGKEVPERFRSVIERLQADYQTARHEAFSGPNNGRLVVDSDFAAYLAARFAIVGTPRAWIDRIHHLQSIGVQKLWITVHAQDPLGFVKKFGREVLPFVTT